MPSRHVITSLTKDLPSVELDFFKAWLQGFQYIYTLLKLSFFHNLVFKPGFYTVCIQFGTFLKKLLQNKNKIFFQKRAKVQLSNKIYYFLNVGKGLKRISIAKTCHNNPHFTIIFLF